MAKIKGTGGNDILFGTNKADVIFGRGGDDTISGGNGNDKIFGGSGNDWIDAGDGNDKISGGKGNDTIYGGDGHDRIDGGKGDDYVDGGDGNDRIDGGKGNDTIYGGAGNDWIDGGKGNDFVDGGTGNDKIFGGKGDDTIFGGAGNDKIDGGKGNDIVYGEDGNDKINGGKGDDTIYGGAGNDRIKGGSGDDLITGGAGADKLTGGSGKDVFVYLDASDSTTESWDRITDFTQGDDKIDLAALLGSTDLAWGNTTATANGAWYQNSGSSTFVFADTNGDDTADLKIELKDTRDLTLTVDDFTGVSDAPQENSAPVAVADNVITNVTGDPFFIPEWALLANDTDQDGDTLVVTNVVGGSTGGTVTWPSSNSPGSVEFSNLQPEVPGSFTYTISDNDGGTDTETVNVTYQEPENGDTLVGTVGDDILVMVNGAGLGTFHLVGGLGNDVLLDDVSDDTLDGGVGNDTLSGGGGTDVFKYSFNPSPTVTSGDGFDTIVDFTFGEDKLDFSGITVNQFLASFVVDNTLNVDGVGGADTVITIAGNADWSLTLLEVSGHDQQAFAGDIFA